MEVKQFVRSQSPADILILAHLDPCWTTELYDNNFVGGGSRVENVCLILQTLQKQVNNLCRVGL